MKVVLDTNVLLVSISRKSRTNWIFQRLLDEDYEIAVTTDILFEYEEIIGREMGATFAREVIEILLDLPNLQRIDRFFAWNLLDDPDDNKFVDCAITAQAHYIVSEDKDFRRLKNYKFTGIEVLTIDQFEAVFPV